MNDIDRKVKRTMMINKIVISIFACLVVIYLVIRYLIFNDNSFVINYGGYIMLSILGLFAIYFILMLVYLNHLAKNRVDK